MKVINLKTNCMENPIGFEFGAIQLNWNVTESKGDRAVRAKVEVAEEKEFQNIVWTKEYTEDCSWGVQLDMSTEACTRYYWRVSITDDVGEVATSESAYFETAIAPENIQAKWISPEFDEDGTLFCNLELEDKVKKARLYISGLGLYEAYLDEEKIGDEYLTPGFNNYASWVQYQTYCIDPAILENAKELSIMLGSGWYKGRYFSMSPVPNGNKYGDRVCAMAELHIWYENGTKEVIRTDEKWQARKSVIKLNSIYDGEEIDENADCKEVYSVCEATVNSSQLVPRSSLPVKCMMEMKPVALIHTPKNETVLDFGQNMVGWISFYNHLKQGESCSYTTGEILQEECFYKDNYKSAKSEFVYHSDGKEKWVRPHFTYYGFRYVKLEGFGDEVNLDDFKAMVLYSDMEMTGEIKTGNELVNQLISNVVWGQRGNFVDVPTDCPQRDERLGWTGDAQVFSMTAAYQMNVMQFFRKYMKDMYTEQMQYGGAVPFVVPNIAFGPSVSAAWGDAATIIPWNMYLMYGDKEVLREQYAGMKAWVEYIRSRDKMSGDNRLWSCDAHFGDWLSLDDPGTGAPTGGTDMTFIATGYYYLSVKLTCSAAKVLGMEADYEEYNKLQQEIQIAFCKEYITESGRLAIDTQTAYAFALYLEIGKKEQQDVLVKGLVRKLHENHNKLATGFVGTVFICQMLTKYGQSKLAYELLLNEEYPGWLYCVKMGATTVWERWNSVLPDGSMNPDGMNSLNHYAYGCIVQWMYNHMLGIEPIEDTPGFERFKLCPVPDCRLGQAEGQYMSKAGVIKSAWKYESNGGISYQFEIPFGTVAEVRLTDLNEKHLSCSQEIQNIIYEQRENGFDAVFELSAGKYEISIKTYTGCHKNYDRYTDISVLMKDEQAKGVLLQVAPELMFMPIQLLNGSLESTILNVFGTHTTMDVDQIEEKIRHI